MAASFGSRSDFDLDGFLRKILTKKQPYQSIFPSSAAVPSWAASCTDLLYSSKSIPTVFSKTNIFYLSYEDSTNELGLVGETHNRKRINRMLKVKAEGSRVVVKSTHMNLQTQNMESFEGKGHTLEAAINDYFLKSDLKHPDYQLTVNNLQKGGDAFLLQNAVTQKGMPYLAPKIIDSVKAIFQLVPEDKHLDLSMIIEEAFKKISKLLNVSENRKIFNHYDPRLWIIVECICQHFDQQQLDLQRKAHRDHVIAQCCTGLMKQAEVFSSLEHYLSALQMHNVLMLAGEGLELHEDFKQHLCEYRNQKLLPEIYQHRDKIKDYFEQYQIMNKPHLQP